MMKKLYASMLPLCFFFLLSPFLSTAQGVKYSTLTNGNWNNTTNVWSLDGISPCFCSPGALIDLIGVEVKHNITMNYNVRIRNSGLLMVAPTGDLSGVSETITVEDGFLNNFGILTINKIDALPLSAILVSGAILAIGGANLTLEGTMAVDNSTLGIINGNIKVKLGGILILSSGTLANLINGNVINEGQIIFDNSCIVTQNGNIKNENTGVVSGVGAVNAIGGNVQNDNIWSVNVDWCATGTGAGMPIAENCTNNTCISILPVQYAFIRAREGLEGNALVEWKTTEEVNNQEFVVLRSADARSFEAVGYVQPEPDQEYSFVDPNPGAGIWFYRIEQVDIEGQRYMTESVALQLGEVEASVSVAPNPFVKDLRVDIRGLEGEKVKISLIDLSGKQVYRDELIASSASEKLDLDMSSVGNGMYILRVSDMKKVRSFRVAKTN